MVRRFLAASGALLALIAYPYVPSAAAEEAVVLVDDGAVRCALSAGDTTRGGMPTAVCQRSDGLPFGQSPFSAEKYAVPLTQAVILGDGRFYWDGGNVRVVTPVPEGGVPVGASGSFSANGWTVQGEGPRTRITNDTSAHGLLIYSEAVRTF